MPSPRPSSGTLHIVATPIGNLGDLSARAIEILRTVSVIVAEDTRHTRKLLAAHDIHSKLSSLHARSAEPRLLRVVERLAQGEDVAYVTDAGCPTISDPGSKLVDAARERSIPVCSVPGPSAITAALSVAGLDAADFRFVGFLPRSRGKRAALLQEALSGGYAVVLFESPARIRALLESIDEAAPERRLATCRELTKIHEEVLRGLAKELLENLPERPRGEYTIVVEAGGPPPRDDATPEEVLERARALRSEGCSTSRAARQVSEETGWPKGRVYQLIVDDEE